MSEFSDDFLEHLESLRSRNPGAMAALRRSLSFAPGVYPPAYPHVERFVAREAHQLDSRRLALYAVAGLYALHPRHRAKVSLARSFGELMRQRESDSIEKRFVALLGADAENLTEYLRQVVSLLAADDLGLDYAALLKDLGYLLNPRLDPEMRDRIRQSWARDFYRSLQPEAKPQTETQPQTEARD